MKFIGNLFKKVDIISPEPKFYIKGEDRFYNLPGIIISLLGISLMLGAVGYFIHNFFARLTPTVIFNEEIDYDYKNREYNFTGYPFVISILDANALPLPDTTRFVRLQPQIWYYFTVIDPVTNKSKQIFNVTALEVEQCDIDKHFGKYRSYFVNHPDLSHHLCPKPGQNFNFFGIYGSSSFFRYLNVYATRCKNNTAPFFQNNCHDYDLIENKLSNSRFSFSYLDHYISNTNFTNPEQITLRREVIPISTTIYKRFWFFNKIVDYQTDVGYVFEDFDKKVFYMSEDAQEKVDLRKDGAPGVPSGSYAQLTFLLHKTKKFFNRKYEKASALLANCGGIINGIFLCAKILNFLVSLRLYNLFMMNMMFNYNEEHEQEEKLVIDEKSKRIKENIHNDSETALRVKTNITYYYFLLLETLEQSWKKKSQTISS